MLVDPVGPVYGAYLVAYQIHVLLLLVVRQVPAMRIPIFPARFASMINTMQGYWEPRLRTIRFLSSSARPVQ